MSDSASFKKLMIVDDHAPTRKWLRSTFGSIATEVCESTDGTEAVRAYPAELPDWVLMDVEMLPMNGLMATRIIKKDYPDAKIMIVSSHDRPGLREAAIAAGAIHFMKKDDLWQFPQIISSLES